MLAAAALLTQFTQSGILLHVVSMNLTVRDEYQVMMFLQMAFAAQQANKARIEAMKRAKHRNAREGRFLGGNRPPYGFLCEVVEIPVRGRGDGQPGQPDQDRAHSRYARDRRVSTL